MAKITALAAQKRNKERVNIFLDGEFAFGITAAAAMNLCAGQELSDAEIVALKELDEVEKARNVALGLISRRPRSTVEIERHLRNKGDDDLVIGQVVERLTNVGLLDDTAFAAYWIEQRETFKPRSRLALRQELMQKGVDRAITDAALEDFDEDAAAQEAAAKQARRWTHLPEEEYQVKLGRYLQRLGFPFDIIKETVNRSWQSLNEEEVFDGDWPAIEGD